MSLFDPASLLQAPLPDANDTKRTNLPAGEVIGVCSDVEIVSGHSPKTGDLWVKVNSKYEITDQEYLKPANLEKAILTYGMMLELTDGGAIATGTNKNVKFGAWRAAHRVNVSGKQLTDAVGTPAKLMIGQRVDPEKKDDDGKFLVYDDVKGITRA